MVKIKLSHGDNEFLFHSMMQRRKWLSSRQERDDVKSKAFLWLNHWIRLRVFEKSLIQFDHAIHLDCSLQWRHFHLEMKYSFSSLRAKRIWKVIWGRIHQCSAVRQEEMKEIRNICTTKPNLLPYLSGWPMAKRLFSILRAWSSSRSNRQHWPFKSNDELE